MTDLITADKAQKLLDHYDLPTDCDCDGEDCVKCSHYPTFQEHAAKKLKEIAPDLARTVIALHAELAQARADAQAAVALVVERAILSVQSHYGCLMGAPPALISAIRAIADTDGTGESE
jgi:hypothetical protein